MIRHFNIPIFMPEMACPFRCAYCDQHRISGQNQIPDAEQVNKLIQRNLGTFPKGPKQVEIAFFGGNFTGLPYEMQRNFLAIAQNYLRSGEVQGIRLSTRPDYIDAERLQLLKDYGVSTIELGAQSLDAGVLQACGRGHGPEAVEQASEMILASGFRLGLQMMIGLPGDTIQKSVETAKRIIALNAHETRIYPCLIVKSTELEQMYLQGKYLPVSLDVAVEWSLKLWLLFRQAGVNVIRIGLHPSEGLHGDALVAGPYHPSFKELVMTALWRNMFEKYPAWPQGDSVLIEVPANELGVAIGHKAANRIWLSERYPKVVFTGREGLAEHAFIIKRLDEC
jgi:histone acetyltransferase (RNA polymerase elongator complex component)